MKQRLHSLLLRTIKFPVYLFLLAGLNYHRHLTKHIDGPFIVMSNHNTDLDPLFVSAAFRQHMYAVASEHIFRRGFATWLLRVFLAPISRPKGSTATSTVIEMLRRLREGYNILLFAEGNKSYNGLTTPILPSTGKLVKKARCTLVTFRLTGGYFTSPRWGIKKFRRGRMDGSVVNVYPPEKIAGMSADEVNAAIAADIFEDAYAQQEKNPTRFRSNRRAEGIETALFLCPSCRRLGTLKSRGNGFFCPCGLCGEYDEFGFISGNFPFKTIRDWDLWELDELGKNVCAGDENVYFSEPGLRLCAVTAGVGSRVIDSGTLSVSGTTLRCGNTPIPISSIEDISIHGSSALIMTVSGMGYLEIPSDRVKYRGRIFALIIEEVKRQLAAQGKNQNA